jgi:predicted TIM-barrel fold metal-dependent hydrolase
MRDAPLAIDVWMQHPTKRFIEQPMFDSLRRWMGSGSIVEIPLEFTLAAMEAGGVGMGLLAAWHGPQGALISNEEVAGWVDAHPDKFVGVCSVNLYQPMEAVRAIRHFVIERGFKAVRLVPWLWNLPPNDRRYYPVYTACCDLGVPFLTQIGHTGPLCPSEPGRPIPYLDEVLLDFPGLVIVGGHVGVPWMGEVLSLARKYPNFYIDTSAYKAKRLPPELIEYMHGRGRNKVLFGTNFPMITPQDCLDGLENLELDEESTRLYLRDNATRLFGL